jgi:hypothetical protein
VEEKNNEVQSKGHALIAWTKVCTPKDQGGLGVLHLDTQNNVVMLINLHIFITYWTLRVNLICNTCYQDGSLLGNHTKGSFWWKARLKLLDKFKGIGRCNIEDGRTVYLWTNL